jgi:hypothetical protein
MKTCLECAHFYFDGGSPGYSDYTPGDDMEISCNKGVWYAGVDTDLTEYRKYMRTAATCPKFEKYEEGK